MHVFSRIHASTDTSYSSPIMNANKNNIMHIGNNCDDNTMDNKKSMKRSGVDMLFGSFLCSTATASQRSLLLIRKMAAAMALATVAMMAAMADVVPNSSNNTLSSSFIVTGATALQTTAPFATLAFTKAKILSGMKLSDCDPNPLHPDCDNGLSSARQVYRNVLAEKKSQNTEFFFNFDKDTAFVQMSPSNYGINIQTMQKFGIRYYFGESTIWSNTDNRRMDLFDTDDVRYLQTNMRVDPTFEWYGNITREVRLFDDAVGVIIVGSSVITYAVDGAAAIMATVKYLRSRVKTIVVVNNDNIAVAESWYTMLEAIQPNPPDVYVYNDYSLDPALATCATVLGVRTCPITYSYDLVNLVHLYFAADINSSNSSGGTTRMVLVDAESSSESISGIVARNLTLDSTFYSDHEFLLTEAVKAIAHDPVVGHMSIPMPEAGMVNNIFHCYKGECPIGTLRARALIHWVPGSHISVSNSGGFRGFGWPAGDIRMSNIWEFNPFANTITVLKVSGFKIWEIMNVSLSFYNQADTYYHYGDRFLQGEGYQIDFDATKPKFTDRILAIRIRDPETGIFEPLVRNKIYTVVTDEYMVTGMGDHSPVMSNLRRGETKTSYTEIAQNAVAEYLLSLGDDDYTNIYNNHITYVSDVPAYHARTGTTGPMVWIQTKSSCSRTQRWDEGIVTCVECPANYVQSPVDAAECVVDPSSSDNTTLIIAIIIPVAAAFLIMMAVVFIYLESKRRASMRNTDFAPKNGEELTIIFTDIRSSTKLWANIPASMAVALEIHHRVIRSCIVDFCAYEVKTIGDSFMIASNNVDNAIEMAVAIQERLAEEAWPIAIAEVYACEGEIDELALLNNIDDEPNKFVVKTEGFTSGIRVRIGLHAGLAEATFDEVAKGYDYYGPAVNMAARIESAAQGGQILTSREVAIRATSMINILTSAEASATGDGGGALTNRNLTNNNNLFAPPTQNNVNSTNTNNNNPNNNNSQSRASNFTATSSNSDNNDANNNGNDVGRPSSSAKKKKKKKTTGGYMITHFTETELPGIAGMTELMQITPMSLAHRVFLPGRIMKKTLEDSDRSDSTFDEAIKAHGIVNFESDSEGVGAGGEDSLGYHLTEAMSAKSYSLLSREVLLAVLRLMDPATRDRVMNAVAAAWRVQPISALTNKKLTIEEIVKAVAHRAGPSVKRSVTSLVLVGPSGGGAGGGSSSANRQGNGRNQGGSSSRNTGGAVSGGGGGTTTSGGDRSGGTSGGTSGGAMPTLSNGGGHGKRGKVSGRGGGGGVSISTTASGTRPQTNTTTTANNNNNAQRAVSSSSNPNSTGVGRIAAAEEIGNGQGNAVIVAAAAEKEAFDHHINKNPQQQQLKHLPPVETETPTAKTTNKTASAAIKNTNKNANPLRAPPTAAMVDIVDDDVVELD